MSQLNPTEEQATAYASHFIKNSDKGKAFRNAFPKTKAKQSSIHENACRLHKNVKIQTRIEELQAISSRNSEKTFELSTEKIKKMLLEVAKKGIKNKTDQHGNEIPAHPTSVVSALAEINKMDGNHAATKQDHTSSDGSMSPRNFNDFYPDGKTDT